MTEQEKQNEREPFTYNSAFGGDVCAACNHAPCQCKVDAWWLRDWHAEAIQREKACLEASIATAQAHITALLERPLDAQDYQAEQVYSNLADGIARAYTRIAEIDAARDGT